MPVNHSLPTLSTNYADFLTTISDRIKDSATLFLGTDYTNIPTGSFAFDRTGNFFKEWSGSAWTTKVLDPAGGGTGVASLSALATAMSLGDLATQDTINNTDWSGEALSVDHGGTGVDTIEDLQTALGLQAMAYQAANNIAVTGGTLSGLSSFSVTSGSIGTLTSTTVQSGSALSLKSASGNNIGFTIGSTVKLEVPVSGTGALFPGADNTFTIGHASGAFLEMHSYKWVTKNAPVFYNSFAYTTINSLNPAAATAADVANYVLSLSKKLNDIGIIYFGA